MEPTTDGKSLIYSIKSKGPRIEPYCGPIGPRLVCPPLFYDGGGIGSCTRTLSAVENLTKIVGWDLNWEVTCILRWLGEYYTALLTEFFRISVTYSQTHVLANQPSL